MAEFEVVMLALRLDSGIPATLAAPGGRFAAALSWALDRGLLALSPDGTRLALTTDGRLLSNEVFGRLLD